MGLNQETRQLHFYLGNLTSDQDETWWMVSKRHLLMLDFFLDHRVYFDSPPKGPTVHLNRRRGRETYDIHFDADLYERFKTSLNERVDEGPVEQTAWVSPKKLYALVEILALIVDQMDYDMQLNENDFESKWGYFLDLLESEASE